MSIRIHKECVNGDNIEDIKTMSRCIMGNYYPPFSLRVSEEIIAKMKIIAAANKRSATKEMEVALEKYIASYESENGEIILPDNYLDN